MTNIGKRISNLWWIPLLTGIVCLGFGIWIFLAPVQAVPVMAVVFAIGLLLTGLLNLILGCATRNSISVWGWALVLGLIEIIAGVWMLCLPEAEMEVAFLFIVGIMVLTAALNAIVEAFTLSARNVWWAIWSVMLLMATVALAIIMFANPVAWGATSVICLGCAMIFFGTYRIGLAVTLRRLTNIAKK